jgi:hypothetical protein
MLHGFSPPFIRDLSAWLIHVPSASGAFPKPGMELAQEAYARMVKRAVARACVVTPGNSWSCPHKTITITFESLYRMEWQRI